MRLCCSRFRNSPLNILQYIDECMRVNRGIIFLFLFCCLQFFRSRCPVEHWRNRCREEQGQGQGSLQPSVPRPQARCWSRPFHPGPHRGGGGWSWGLFSGRRRWWWWWRRRWHRNRQDHQCPWRQCAAQLGQQQQQQQQWRRHSRSWSWWWWHRGLLCIQSILKQHNGAHQPRRHGAGPAGRVAGSSSQFRQS